MARDYFAIQGSATPSERAFSSASLTDTKQRSRLTPQIFEALQILKSAYRNGHISATVQAEMYFQRVMNAEEVEEGDDEGISANIF